MTENQSGIGLEPIVADVPETPPIGRQDETSEPDEQGLSQLSADLDEIKGRLDQLQSSFDKRIALGSSDAQTITRLTGEVQELRGNLYRKILGPLLKEMADLRESMNEVVEGCRRNDAELSPDVLEAFSEEIARVLDAYNVEIVEVAPGDRFDPKTTRASGREPTREAALDGTIAQRRGDSYLFEGAILRKALVRVYAYEAPDPDACNQGN